MQRMSVITQSDGKVVLHGSCHVRIQCRTYARRPDWNSDRVRDIQYWNPALPRSQFPHSPVSLFLFFVVP